MSWDAILIVAFGVMIVYLIDITIKARRRSLERRLSKLEREVRQKR